MTPSRTPHNLGLFLGFLALSAVYYHTLFLPHYYIDDAYIYLRVIQNILDGHGWVYNLGEALNNCSSTSYAIALLLVSALLQPFATIVSIQAVPAIIQLLSTAMTAVLVLNLLRPLPWVLRLSLALTIAFHPMLLRTAGMESAFFVFMACLSCYCLERSSGKVLGVVLALLGLTRPEGYALAGLIFMWLTVMDRPRLLPACVTFFLLTAAWYCFSYLYFDSLIPHSTLVKTLQPATMAGGLGYDINQLSFLSAFWNQNPLMFLTLAVACIGCIPLYRISQEVSPFLGLVVLYSLIQFTVYHLRHALAYIWYFLQIDVAVNILFVLGLFQILRWTSSLVGSDSLSTALGQPTEPADKEHARTRLLQPLLLAAIVLATLRFGALPWKPSEPYRNAATYWELGTWLNKNSAEGDMIATIEVGYLGFFSNRQMIDKMGLTQRDSIEGLKKSDLVWWYKLQPRWILRFRGDFSFDSYFHPGPDSDFKDRYILRHRQDIIEVWERLGTESQSD